jgi:hypothetical protein
VQMRPLLRDSANDADRHRDSLRRNSVSNRPPAILSGRVQCSGHRYS